MKALFVLVILGCMGCSSSKNNAKGSYPHTQTKYDQEMLEKYKKK